MDMLACLCVSLQRIIGIVSYELKAKATALVFTRQMFYGSI